MTVNDKPIHNFSPHYTNKAFQDAKVVWGKKIKVTSSEYSDRLVQWDYKKHTEAVTVADEKATRTSSLWVEEYLSVYFDKPIQLVYVMAGWNWSTGYSYQVFGWNE